MYKPLAFDKIELMIKAVITMAFDKLKALIRESSDYLQQDEALICEQNLGSLKTVTVVYTLILSAYTILAFTFFQSQVLNFIYLICLAVQYSVDAVSYTHLDVYKRQERDYLSKPVVP